MIKCGTDIIEIARIKDAIEKERFKERVYTEKEIEYCESKNVKKCDMPLTCFKEVNTIITELAILDVTDHGLQLRALAPGVSAEEVQKKTEAEIIIPETIQRMVELQEE